MSPAAKATRGSNNARPTPVTSEVVKITPAQAEQWLGRNSHNRPLRQGVAENLARAIERGEWVLNGDAIRFAVDGSLLDGQHRLWAIVESGIAVESLVVRGLPNVAQESMDMGARRSLKDVLVLRGETSGNRLGAVLTYHWRYVNGHVQMLTAKPTIPQALAHLSAHPALREAGSKADTMRGRLNIATSMFGCFIYEARALDYEETEYFLEKLDLGVGLEAKSPIYVLRRHLEVQRLQQGHPTKANLLVTHALLNKAWNAYRQGEHIQKLTWRAAGANPEPFPKMV